MKIKLKEGSKIGDWHPVFIWFPRIVEDRWRQQHFVWLETIERRWVQSNAWTGSDYWDYRVKDE